MRILAGAHATEPAQSCSMDFCILHRGGAFVEHGRVETDTTAHRRHAALLAVVYDRQAIRSLPPIWPAFALWAAWAFVSLVWSVDPDRALKELRNEIVYVGVAFWMCYVAARFSSDRRRGRGFFIQLSAGLVRSGERWPGGPGNLSDRSDALPCIVMAGWYRHRHRLGVLRNCSIGLSVCCVHHTQSHSMVGDCGRAPSACRACDPEWRESSLGSSKSTSRGHSDSPHYRRGFDERDYAGRA